MDMIRVLQPLLATGQGSSWTKKSKLYHNEVEGSQLWKKKTCELNHDSENSLTAPASFLEPEAFLITSIQLLIDFITRIIENLKFKY